MTEFKLGDLVRPKGRHFATIVYTICNKIVNDFTGETLYSLEPSTIGQGVMNISEDALIEKFTKI
jgi:hypothetical protein